MTCALYALDDLSLFLVRQQKMAAAGRVDDAPRQAQETFELRDQTVDEEHEVPPATRLRNRRLALANAVSFVLVLAVNGLAGSGKLTGTSIGQVSKLFPTYITPEGFAFSIWGLIYTCMSVLVVYQLTPQGARSSRFFAQQPQSSAGIGWAFALSNATNCLWIALFTEHSVTAVWFSCVAIFALLALLLQTYVRARCWEPAAALDKHTCAPTSGALAASVERLGLDVGLSLYCGWVTVASILNVACAAGPGGSNLAGEDPGTNATWAVVMLSAALLINAAVVARRHDPVFPLVLAWAANAIRAKHHHDSVDQAAGVIALCAIALAACAVRLRARSNAAGADAYAESQ